MLSSSEKLKAIATPSNWKEKVKYRKENKNWLDKSADIALDVLEALDNKGKSQTCLAEQMGVSRQQVSKIVKGSENLTLKTIVSLEQILGLELIAAKSEALVNP